MGRRLSIFAGAVALFIVSLAASAPLTAWFADDAGNLSLFKRHPQAATSWFEYGLKWEPRWSLLHEDLGRSLLDSDPAAALSEFRIADCGAPCTAEQGDALLRLGRREEAIRYYVAAKAVARLGERAEELASHGDDREAILLEQALIAQLHDNFLERAELASAYATLGSLQERFASKQAAQALPLRRDAIGSFLRASSLAPFNERYLLLYGFAEKKWGDPTLARAAFERLLQLHPHQRDAQAALAELAHPAAQRRP